MTTTFPGTAGKPLAWNKFGRSGMGVLLGAMLAFVMASGVLATGAVAQGENSAGDLSGVVGITSTVPGDARTAKSLGTERTGTGVVIDNGGLVLTIGYLILEADSANIIVDGREVPAIIVAYDHETGFGLLRASRDLDVTPLKLGSAQDVVQGDRVLVASNSNGPELHGAFVADRRVYTGYWEYMLDSAILTTPPTGAFGGAALVDAGGRLVGVGSLIVSGVLPGEQGPPGNMFVPIDLLKPVMADLIAEGRRPGPYRPWIGVYTEEDRDHVWVSRLASEGPGEKVGLRKGDLIVALDGTPVDSLESFYRVLWSLGSAGVEVPVTVLRGGALETLAIKSADRYRWLRLRRSY